MVCVFMNGRFWLIFMLQTRFLSHIGVFWHGPSLKNGLLCLSLAC